MANDASPVPAGAHDAQARTVRHFRQIVLWPIQLISGKANGKRDSADALFERLGGGNWELVDDEFGVEADAFQERHYREFVSFLPHVQRFLYGDAPGSLRRLGKGDAPLRVYRRTDIAAVRMVLAPGGEPVTCRVAHVDLHFFHDVDAVILAFEFYASDLPLSVVHEIMYRFGRAYPPGWTETGEPLHCPAHVEWLDKDDRVLATSDYQKRERYLSFVGHQRTPCFAAHWEFLLMPLVAENSGSKGPLSFRQIEYYRMPVMTYLTLDRMWDMQRTDYMRLAFATGASPNGDAPFAERFLHDFEARNCYDRYYHEGSEAAAVGTRFLLSGHAFTVVADGVSPRLEDNERGLLGQFRHQYFLLFLISHFHKAALLMLSDRLVAAIKLLEMRSAQSAASFRRETYRLQEAFMRFTQRYWFTEVSDQAQTRDLFRMQRAHLGNDDLYKELRNEIFDMVQYLDSDVLRRQSGSFHRLTAVTIIGLIGTTATGFLGMNLIDETGAPLLVKLGYFCIVAAAVTALTVGVVAFSRSLTALLDRMSGERP
ncbi:hypothetical protein GIW81_05105 [Hyphomicrobium sp. xq]|uniref:CorA-like Mg2+ transporter protein n=1 Tax=Hyphomicrobium album TaxID=2665159 RepID=A0A6I3KLW9_9HYPH|nr:hypothetical protein [Hyphomicrobium album]MTD93711.1 hypothetical protein [Hyphomicrobium album]